MRSARGADKVRKDYLASIAPQVKEREAKIRELRGKLPDYNTDILVTVTANEQIQVPTAGALS